MKKQKAMYIIDHDYNLLYMNDDFKKIYPDVRVGKKCHLDILGYEEKCPFCPLSKAENERFFYNEKGKEWIKSDFVNMEYEGKPAICVMFSRWEYDSSMLLESNSFGNDEIKDYLIANKDSCIIAESFDDGFPIIYANDLALELLGYSSLMELITLNNGVLYNLINKNDVNDALGTLKNAIYPGSSYSTSYRIKRHDESYLWVIDSGKVFFDDNNKGIIISVLHDMSDIAALRQQIAREARLVAEQNQKLIFMSNDQPTAYCRTEADDGLSFIEISAQLLNLVGYTRTEIINLFDNKFINLAYSDDLAMLKQAFLNKSIGKTIELDFRLRHKEKGYIYVKCISKYGLYNNKKYIHFSLLDISKEVAQQIMLENRNKQLEIINGTIPGGFKITRCDDDFTLDYVSVEAAKLFGYTPEEFIACNGGSTLKSIYSEDLDSAFMQFRDCFIRDDGIFSIKYRVKCKDGSLKSIIDSGKLVKNELGETLYYSFYLDITKDLERDKLIELQKNNLDQLRLIHALSKDFSVIYSINIKEEAIKLIYVDSVAKKYIASYKQKFEGYYDRMDFYLSSFISKETDRIDLKRKAQLNNVAKELEKDDIYSINYQVNVMGLSQYYQVRYKRIDRNNPNEIIMGIRNLSHETDKFIAESRELAEKLNDAKAESNQKTSFLNSLSHDIRTPMNAIIGFTNLATKYIDDKDVALEYLKKISKSSEHLMSLINDILDMSRIESGKITIEEKPHNLGDLIHNIKSMIQLDVKAKGIGFYIDNVNITHEDVLVDSVRLSQLLLNLLSNSIKFTPAGGTISVRMEEYPDEDEKRRIYELSVKDTGIGMSKEFAQKIFEPFARERTSTVSGIQGTGLGMSIAKSIVDLLGGTIRVESEKGVGTEITIRASFKLNPNIEVLDLGAFNGKRALVIDDNPDVCIDMCNKLSQLGLVCEYKTDAKEGLELASLSKDNNPFSLYLIDWIMPSINGVTVTKLLREAVGNEPRVILASTYDLSEVEIEAKKAGVDYFVAKPVFLNDLKNILKKEINKNMVIKQPKNYDRFRGKRILMAEDNLFNQEIAVEILTSHGFKVEVANNGRMALDMLLDHVDGYYDVILMDIQMPVLDGYQATKIIRRLPNEGLKNIPIIAMSANVFDESIKNSYAVGMNEHLAKPIDVDKLMDALDKIIK